MTISRSARISDTSPYFKEEERFVASRTAFHCRIGGGVRRDDEVVVAVCCQL